MNKQSVPFTQVANIVLNDKQLTWKAKGIYAYLYSKPDGWQFSSERIIEDGIDGEAAVQSGLRELEEAGYLGRRKLGNGRILYDVKYKTPNPRKSSTGKSQSAKTQYWETADISNKDNSNTDKKVILNHLAQAAPDAEWDFEAYKKQMHEDKNRSVQVIALYFDEKKLRFDSKDEVRAAITRHVKDAREVARFSDEKIVDACKVARREYPTKWTISTVLKILTS